VTLSRKRTLHRQETRHGCWCLDAALQRAKSSGLDSRRSSICKRISSALDERWSVRAHPKQVLADRSALVNRRLGMHGRPRLIVEWAAHCRVGRTGVAAALQWTSAVQRRLSRRCEGAVPLRQQYTRTHRRNLIRSGTRNQQRSRRSGVMCSERLA